jgi:hypothetical protein
VSKKRKKECKYVEKGSAKPGLPDGIFLYQNNDFATYILEGSAVMSIWPFYCLLVDFFPVLKCCKIWQPWSRRTGKDLNVGRRPEAQLLQRLDDAVVEAVRRERRRLEVAEHVRTYLQIWGAGRSML